MELSKEREVKLYRLNLEYDINVLCFKQAKYLSLNYLVFMPVH